MPPGKVHDTEWRVFFLLMLGHNQDQFRFRVKGSFAYRNLLKHELRELKRITRMKYGMNYCEQ